MGLWEFVAKDLEILNSNHEVRPFHFQGLKDLPALWQGVRWCDLTFSWFGTYHAFFTVGFGKIQRKKSVVVSGGYDVAKTPLLPKYGPLNKFHKRWGVLFVYANADLILSVSEFNRRESIENAGCDPKKIKVISHGFNTDVFRPLEATPKNGTVLTVGTVHHVSNMRKGIDLFVRSAKYLPESQFEWVGRHNESALYDLKKIAPPNVKFKGYLTIGDLVKTYTQANVYVQPSRHEAFGCSVAEAMLCECVPVVSREGALPEVVGSCGLYVESLNPEAVADKIKEALESKLGPKARERIKYLYPIERREREILEAIENLNI